MSAEDTSSLPLGSLSRLDTLSSLLLSNHAAPQTVEIHGSGASSTCKIGSVRPTGQEDAAAPFSTEGLFALPSLCHPHLHLDKAYLLTHPDTRHLSPETGDFSEALRLTAEAKGLYTTAGLGERMDALLADSSRAGVTHARAFAEVDAGIGHRALDAAIAAQLRWRSQMHLQICAFAQDPLFSGPHAEENRQLLEQAASRDEVETLGATPYVEEDRESLKRNIDWTVGMAITKAVHLDFHLDYNIDPASEPTVWAVLEALRRESWTDRNPGKTVCLGHCTRLAGFSPSEWARLRHEAAALPVFFVGLPTSDLFMMGRPDTSGSDDSERLYAACCDRPRATLPILAMRAAGFDVCLGINNVGNAFTPYGSADPLSLAQWGVGLFQAATPAAAELLFDCVSRSAKAAIGVLEENGGDAGKAQPRQPGEIREGDPADLVLIGRPKTHEGFAYRRHQKLCEVVWDAGSHRKTVYNGLWSQV